MMDAIDETARSHAIRRPRNATKWIWIVAIVAGGVLVWIVAAAWIDFFSRPANELALRGGLRIDADPRVSVYVGQAKVGTGPVEVAWDEILDASGGPSLAIPIDPSLPSPHITSIGGVSAAALAGEGSEMVWKKDSMSGTNQMVQPTVFAFKEVIIRRAGGALDHAYVLDAAFPNARGRWQRLLIPIRLRSAKNEATYFADPQSMGTLGDRGIVLPGTNFAGNLWFTVRFGRGQPPEEFAEEISRTGLWAPGR